MSTAAGLRSLARDVVAPTRSHDLALCAAAVTFHATVGLVPLLLVALFLAAQVAGESMVRMLADGLTGLLPDELGAGEAARFLASSGTAMSPLAALAALVPASLYGEGLVRALDRISARPGRRRSTRGRFARSSSSS